MERNFPYPKSLKTNGNLLPRTLDPFSSNINTMPHRWMLGEAGQMMKTLYQLHQFGVPSQRKRTRKHQDPTRCPTGLPISYSTTVIQPVRTGSRRILSSGGQPVDCLPYPDT